MAAGRWMLVVAMVVAGPLLWWGGVNATASAARSALAPGDASLPYFVAAYRSGGLTMTGVLAGLNLLLVLALVPGERRLREARTGTAVRAVVAAVLVTGVAWLEDRFNPVVHHWSGDPDARSTVGDFISWHPAVGTVWLVLTAAAAAAIAARAVRRAAVAQQVTSP